MNRTASLNRSRRVILWLRRAMLAGAILLAGTAACVIAQALWLARVADLPEPAGVIIVLGGAMEDDALGRETIRRTETAARLYCQGLAPRIHFTGGGQSATSRGAGAQMRALAQRLGVPRAASSAENRSRSTLQNALLSRGMLGSAATGPVILVSDGYHLGRAWASFRWAGYGPPIRLAAATAFGHRGDADQVLRLARETAAWWFNLARVLVWHGAGLAGLTEAQRLPLLD